jgi:hypothetical protein
VMEGQAFHRRCVRPLDRQNAKARADLLAHVLVDWR